MATCIWISTSSNDFNTAANWSSGSVPVAGDTVVFNGTGTAALTTNINQSTVAFAAIFIEQANAAQIGSLTTGGVATYFQHAAPNVYIGQQTGNGSPTGSQLVLLDSGATSCAYAIYDSANSTAVNAFLPPIQIKGSALTLDITGGNVGLAVRAGETATATINISQGGGVTVSSPALYLGTGVTLSSLKQDAGYVLNRTSNTVTAATINGGTYEYQGTGAHTTLTVSANSNNTGICYYSGTGTITTLNLDGQFNRTRDGRTVTITNTTLSSGFSLFLDNGVSGSTVFTNKPTLSGCSMSDGTFTTPIGDLV